MAITIAKADSKKRIVIPLARPGDVFDVQEQGEGRVLLVRLVRPQPKTRKSRREVLKAMKKAPLHPKMSWEELRRITREP